MKLLKALKVVEVFNSHRPLPALRPKQSHMSMTHQYMICMNYDVLKGLYLSPAVFQSIATYQEKCHDTLSLFIPIICI